MDELGWSRGVSCMNVGNSVAVHDQAPLALIPPYICFIMQGRDPGCDVGQEVSPKLETMDPQFDIFSALPRNLLPESVRYFPVILVLSSSFLALAFNTLQSPMQPNNSCLVRRHNVRKWRMASAFSPALVWITPKI